MIVRLFYLLVFAQVVMVPIPAQEIHLGNFNPLPELPFEATSVEQDEWFKEAQVTIGDSIEAGPLAACAKLISDPATPHDLVRWAWWREVELRTYIGKEREAIEMGFAWLDLYPEEKLNLNLHYVMGRICADRGHATFQPDRELVFEVFNSIFASYDTSNLLVIKARTDFARKLNWFADDPSINELRKEQLDIAEADLRRHHLDHGLNIAEQQRQAAKNLLERIVLPMKGIIVDPETRARIDLEWEEMQAELRAIHREQLQDLERTAGEAGQP